LAEVAAGKVAERRGDETVKAVGLQMVTDHTKADDELESVAKAQGLVIPTQPDAAHVASLAQLRKAKGSAFNNEYLEGQLTDHQRAIALFQQESQQGTDPQLKTFAANTLPILQQHLDMVKSALR
jgi:putative membrane protein